MHTPQTPTSTPIICFVARSCNTGAATPSCAPPDAPQESRVVDPMISILDMLGYIIRLPFDSAIQRDKNG
ncbi:hypothetical protein RSAG8_11689, partial [Rhizoctonia solani AG-8 WAC10335]